MVIVWMSKEDEMKYFQFSDPRSSHFQPRLVESGFFYHSTILVPFSICNLMSTSFSYDAGHALQKDARPHLHGPPSKRKYKSNILVLNSMMLILDNTVARTWSHKGYIFE